MVPGGEGETSAETGARAGPRLWLARGARAAETALLDAVDALAAAGRADPTLLARPVRVVVPSRSLREHVAARMVERAGRAVAGVRVQTLHGLAMEVIDAAGEAPPVGDPLFPLLVRRAAREAPALRAVLEDLEDGYAAVAAEVADLLDAGWSPAVPAHAEALEEALAAEPSSAAADRARAVAAVASRVGEELERHGCGRRGTRLARAAELLGAAPERLLPARAILVHGFADATAVASDLIEALMRGCDARVLLDEPPDPAAPERPAPGARFTARLRERLGRLVAERVGPAPAPARIELLRAPGAHPEVRGVAERVRELLDAGVRPEAIGVVARSLEPYRVPLRVHFRRLGIPFSGIGAAAPPTAAGRRLHALLDLLRLGPRLSAERWLEIDGLASRSASPWLRADLRLALHGLGVARLEGLAELDVAAATQGRERLPLAVRRGFEVAEAEDDDGQGPEAREPRVWARRRSLHRSHLEDAVARAGAVRDALREWPDLAPLRQHMRALDTLVDAHLGWPGASPERRALAERLDALERELPATEPLERDELRLLLGRALRDAGCEPLGGAGAGVQVLGVVEARARTFEHLFVLGMNRDVFPRPIVEAPLLPDDLRRRLEARLLPEIAVKRRGFEEEHYLFAQLLSASPRVVLSWQETSDDGRARPPSPLLERLRIAREDLEEEAATSLHARPGPRARLTAAEATVLEGLHGSGEALAPLLAAALRERWDGGTGPGGEPAEAPALARARLAVLAEQDAGPAPRSGLGPYFGFVGPVGMGADPRRQDLYVTRVEGLARCPWQVFVARLLGVEPVPDALDALPELAGLRGTVTHRALERIVADAWPGEVPRELEACAAAEPVALPWPSLERLEVLIREAAEGVLREEGLGPPVLARLLALDARPFVEAARTLDWPVPGTPGVVVGVEVQGAVAFRDAAGRPRTLRFKADRADRADRGDRADRAGPEGGPLRLLDYKTGNPISNAVKPETRARHLRERIAAGRNLQASAYAAAGGGEGVYLFLRHPDEPGGRLAVEAGDPELDEAFRSAATTILTALDEGALFPRLTEPEGDKTFAACAWCQVREACLQGDSGARLRLVGWMHDAEGAEPSPAERAARSLWWIGRAQPEEGREGRDRREDRDGGNG